MDSLWSSTSQFPERASLQQDIHTDVLIIGGGITGILCAYQLAQAGISYALVESEKVCSGITKNTTAKITSQHGLIYSKLIKKFGLENAKQYLDANEAALQEYRRLCSGIDCDFESKDSFVYSLDGRKKIDDEIEALLKLNYPVGFQAELPLPLTPAGAVKFPNQAQFHPLKFLSAISKGLNIYEHTRVQSVKGHSAKTEHGKIKAEKIIVATHFPFINSSGSYFLKQYQHRSYVLGLENAADVNGMYVDEDNSGLSFRNADGLLLLGGGGHRTGHKGGSYAELEGFAKMNYPDSKIAYRWATQDCMTLDGAPYIGQYAKNTPEVFVATGFNKWGMTSAMAAAMILKDMIIGADNPFAEVFNPSRSMLHPQLAINAAESTLNLLTPSFKRCPHLGCALKWNAAERSWDCSCHGSRFDEHGKLIDNPAAKDSKV